MTTIPHETGVIPARERRSAWFLVREMWASLAIAVIWLAVLFDAVFGPNIVNSSAGGSSSSVPSVIPVALFAFLATWPVAKYGFRRDRGD
jgi:hypothetical protein